MQLTRSADYGVRIMVHLAGLPHGSRINALELATASDAPVPFVEKILGHLARARLVVSHRGQDGGFELGAPADSISLLDVINALEGPLCLNACLPGGKGCHRRPVCAVHLVWAETQAGMQRTLGGVSIATLAIRSARLRTAQGAPSSAFSKPDAPNA